MAEEAGEIKGAEPLLGADAAMPVGLPAAGEDEKACTCHPIRQELFQAWAMGAGAAAVPCRRGPGNFGLRRRKVPKVALAMGVPPLGLRRTLK
jgi:hypothetical protein